jgi:Tol biopolymer transport system component
MATNLVEGDTNGARDTFIFNRVDKSFHRVDLDASDGQIEGSYQSSMSRDGRAVVFASLSSNVTDGNYRPVSQIYIRDLDRGITERVSVSNFGNQSSANCFQPFVGPDGRFVSFASKADNLALNDSNDQLDLFLRQR